MSENPVRIQVKHRFSASAERVFDAWTNPDVIAQWGFSHVGLNEEVLHLKTDVRVGGQFSFLVRRDGEELDHMGTYLEVERPQRLVFTWGVNEEAGDESRVTIDIVPQDSGCLLTLTHEMDPKWAEYAERTKNGWTKMLQSMAEAVD